MPSTTRHSCNNSSSSSVPTTNYNTQSGYLGTSYGIYNADSIPGPNTMAVIGNGTNSVPSPARRHEVSPIQCHKTSRFGWHSPTHGNKNQIMSPKSEHFSRIQKHHTLDNSKNLIFDSTAYNIKSEQAVAHSTFKSGDQDTLHNMYNNNNNSKSNNMQYNSKTIDDRNYKMNSSNTAEILKSKCYTNQQNSMDQQYIQHHQHQQQRNIRHIERESDEQNNKLSSFKTSEIENLRNRNKFENSSISHPMNRMNSNNSLECNQSIQIPTDQKQFKRITEFEPSANSNSCHQSKINYQNNNMDMKTYSALCHNPKSDMNKINASTTKSSSTSTSAFAKTYKKIFSNSSGSADRSAQSQIVNDQNYDKLNANLSPHYYQHQMQYQNPDNYYYNGSNSTINNNNNIDTNNAVKGKIKKSERKQLTESGYYEMVCGGINPTEQNSLNSHIKSHQATIHPTTKSRNPSYEINRVTTTNTTNYLVMGSTNLHNRNGRQNSMIGPTNSQQPPQPNSNHPLAHVINSLSSPESAYSTGYSTDGTSPGTTYTPPEYYINMRTGTHYFPKNANALGVELSRQKFGLNKIEEILSTHHHRRTESYDLNQIKITHMELIDGQNFQKKHTEHIQHFEQQHQGRNSSTPQFQNNSNALIVNCRGYESPSPRQRSRIRTNPWYSTPESSFSTSTSHSVKKTDLDTSSSSSGIKSNSDIRTSMVDDEKSKESSEVSEEESESSSTEVEVDLSKKIQLREKNFKQQDENGMENSRPLSTDQVFNSVDFTSKSQNVKNRPYKNDNFSIQQDSDEDTTLNEMMGKFDESYIYEKETDILSNDSDPTHCNSDIDTGQDAGDEYDTEDLLDIDFIDTGSIQEIVEKSEVCKNTGNCSYYIFNPERRMSKNRRSRKTNEEIVTNISNSGKRKKRLLKTRKKSCESKERQVSPLKNKRESRSVGGTPVCLRRRISSRDKKHETKISPLVHQQRSNSLTLTEVHTVREKYIAIAESEKMLLKADLEADIKYKQLIHEAESILVSMKANAVSLPRETPAASPSRRILNPPANKRVEMLRQCDADLKREIQKQHYQQQQQHSDNSTTTSEHLINKRLEMLRHEYNSSNSVPTSPKCGRLSPRKTHLTNFINQVASSDIAWRTNPVSSKNRSNEHLSSDDQQTLSIRNRQFNRESSLSPPPPVTQPPPPPIPRRNFGDKSFARTFSNYSNSNSDEELNEKSLDSVSYSSRKSTVELEMDQDNKNVEHGINNHIKNKSEINSDDNYIFEYSDYMAKSPSFQNKQPLISFKSVDMGNKIIEMGGYCPQSEPLKRKIYKGSSSFERIKKSLDIDTEIPKPQSMLSKIHSIQHDQQVCSNRDSKQDVNCNLQSSNNINDKSNNNNNINSDNNNLQDQSAYQSNDEDSVSVVSNLSVKQQLILSTIEDLKKSLEDQSVELTAQFENTKLN
ncbi:putative uncharacterized protein DDB_G0282133 isoform X2 [Condylostylus longicornis]|uniref:putative uncharacterized protein DDB_G0282133 isoform X2 n=1 Tax=Condylostylus longicornis TaxID=2530218 RepID=UPI00244E17EE|nr:putative uncharacterized protein DDB_G0282133 isoform X2 [Condylostylus longicornis]